MIAQGRSERVTLSKLNELKAQAIECGRIDQLALQGLVPYLVHTYPVFDMDPATINLYVIKLTFGISFAPNLMSILGIVLAIFLFRRY